MAKKIPQQPSIKNTSTGTLEMVSEAMQHYIDEAKRYRIRALAAKSNVERTAFEQRAKECEDKAKQTRDKILKSCSGVEYATKITETETL